jgi:hypothetical protein
MHKIHTQQKKLCRKLSGNYTPTKFLQTIFGNHTSTKIPSDSFLLGKICCLQLIFCSGHPNETQQQVGCDIKTFSWCADLPAVNVWVYYGFYVLFIGISFPLLTITLTTLFSRILGPRRQGTQQVGFFIWFE